MQNEMRDRLIEEPNYCDYCFNFDKEHIGMNGTAVCKLTNKIVYSEDGGDCPFFNVPKERIIVPPCKVGDTVYEINTTFPDTPYINDFVVVALHITSGKNSLGHKKPSHAVVTPNKFMPPITKRIYLEKFGKTVFLTKEEAEKALKEGADNR